MKTSLSREWAMPNSDTFTIDPIRRLVERIIASRWWVVVDPFARNSSIATVTNDMNPDTSAQHHMDAVDFCAMLVDDGVKADAVIFDPPYSPRQIAECYAMIGRSAGTKDTQNGRLYREVRDMLDLILKTGGRALSFGWSSSGFGETRGYRKDEIMLVCHGGAHNDTIVTVETKMQGGLL